jgi:MscS family membrane protein
MKTNLKILFIAGLLLSGFVFPRLDAVEKKTDTVAVNTIKIETKKVVIADSVKKVNSGTEADSNDDSDDPKLNKKSLEDVATSMGNIWTKVSSWWKKQKMAIAILFGGILVTLLVVAIVDVLFVKIFIEHVTSKTETEVDDMIGVAVRPPLKLFVFSIGFLCSSIPILKNLEDAYFEVFIRVIAALAATAVAVGCYRLVTPLNHVLTKIAARTDNTIDDLIVALLRKAIKITLVVVSVLFIGQSILGLNITALVAGAGICGLAIAFAAKDAISNVFGSITIILDRPFQVGDRIQVSGITGVVERVGFRSTRIRTLDGCVVTTPNNIMATAAIENFNARPYIKYTFGLGLTYDTPAEKMERAMEILHEIFDNHKGMSEDLPPRINFTAFNDFSLNIAVIVWYHPGDYFEACGWMTEKNLEILKRFNAEGLEFAFPTSTTFLAGDSSRTLEVAVKNK